MVLAHDINQGKRTRDVQISQDVTFETMLLTPATLEGLKSSGFYKPSPIQLLGIPLGKCGFDLLLEAKSGTGKTAVFTVIALEKLDLNKGLQVVIIAPTREIAAQICDVIRNIGSNYAGLHVEVVMGGLPVQEDILKFKNQVHVVVGSPGRLRHLIHDKHIDVSTVRLFILDEADKLMDNSFQTDIKYIFSVLPKQKQVIMSSATYPESSKLFINSYVQNAQHVCPNSNCILLGVDQKTTVVPYNSNIVRQTQSRFQELLKILKKIQFKQCLIFCNYQVRVSELYKLLTHEKWPVEQLYGQQEQLDRLDALKFLQEYKCRILIATDLAARGIDASNVDLVINFEPPSEWQTYLHRIGRAGRFGSYGISITILSEGKEEQKFRKMLEPMKDSLTLTDFWDVDNKKVDNNLQHIFVAPYIQNSENKTIKNQCQELWDFLTSTDITTEIEGIETFENLCRSIEKEESKIECFEDLLQSFKNNDVDEESTFLFRFIEMPDVSYKENVTGKKLIEKTEHLETDQSTETMYRMEHPNCFETDNSNKCQAIVKNGFENGYQSENSETEHYHCISDSEENINDLLHRKFNENNAGNKDMKQTAKYQIINDNLSLSYSYEATRYISNSNMQPLLDAGLPTCFASSKNKPKKDSKWNKSTHVEHGYKKNKETTSKRNNSNSESNRLHYMKYSNSSKNINSHKCNDMSYKDHNERYYHWYKELKLRVSQIELAVYLDEISK